jgi:sigma-B regulation protein RsbU (phosphoserine phosphatase)
MPCSEDRLEELSTGGPILGIIAGDNYETGEYSLADGDTLVLVSDGVTEAVNPDDEMFDAGRLRTVVSACGCDHGAGEIMDRIIGAVDDFAAGSEQADDISVLVVRRTTGITLAGGTDPDHRAD